MTNADVIKGYPCCKPVFYHHDFGFDIFAGRDCYMLGGKFIPHWFDCAIVEDATTRKSALQELKESHPLGMCLMNICSSQVSP